MSRGTAEIVAVLVPVAGNPPGRAVVARRPAASSIETTSSSPPRRPPPVARKPEDPRPLAGPCRGRRGGMINNKSWSVRPAEGYLVLMQFAASSVGSLAVAPQRCDLGVYDLALGRRNTDEKHKQSTVDIHQQGAC
jgi:hypothetical protein